MPAKRSEGAEELRHTRPECFLANRLLSRERRYRAAREVASLGTRSHRSTRAAARRPVRPAWRRCRRVHAYVIDTGIQPKKPSSRIRRPRRVCRRLHDGYGRSAGRQGRRRLRSTAVPRTRTRHPCREHPGRPDVRRRPRGAHPCASHPAMHRDNPHRFHRRRPRRQLDHRARLEAGGRQHQPGAIRDRRSIARRGDSALDSGGLRLCVVSGRDGEPRQLLAAARGGRDHGRRHRCRRRRQAERLRSAPDDLRARHPDPGRRQRQRHARSTQATAIPMPHRSSQVWRRCIFSAILWQLRRR